MQSLTSFSGRRPKVAALALVLGLMGAGAASAQGLSIGGIGLGDGGFGAGGFGGGRGDGERMRMPRGDGDYGPRGGRGDGGFGGRAGRGDGERVRPPRGGDGEVDRVRLPRGDGEAARPPRGERPSRGEGEKPPRGERPYPERPPRGERPDRPREGRPKRPRWPGEWEPPPREPSGPVVVVEGGDEPVVRRPPRPRREAEPAPERVVREKPPVKEARQKTSKQKPVREAREAPKPVKEARDKPAPEPVKEAREKPAAKPVKEAREKPPQPPKQAARAPRDPLGPSNAPPAGETRYVPDEVVIEFDAALSDVEVDGIARGMRLQRLGSQRVELLDTTIYRWRIPDRRSVPEVVRALEADRRIASAQPNYLYSLEQPAAGAVARAAPQYVLDKLRLGEAHKLTRGETALVAVIDSGIDTRHPELEGVVVDSFDAVGGKFEPHDHGTGMAGAIAARSTLLGVAPGARILAVRAFGGGNGTTFDVVRGLDWAYRQKARVFNMSFAGPKDPKLSRLIQAARGKGIVMVAAAGNQGPASPPLYPAAEDGVIAVTATDPGDGLFAAANRGDHISISAPGVDVLGPAPDGGYAISSGTSVAAAHVSGIVALLLARRPDLPADRVRAKLIETARDLGPSGPDSEFGAGIADAFAAVSGIEAEQMASQPGAVR